MSNVEYILVMNFETEQDKPVSMSITGVLGTLTGSDIQAVMDTVIQKNIFETKYGDIVAKKSAFITEKLVRELNISAV